MTRVNLQLLAQCQKGSLTCILTRLRGPGYVASMLSRDTVALAIMKCTLFCSSKILAHSFALSISWTQAFAPQQIITAL